MLDKLRQHGVAANVSLRTGVKDLRIQLTDHEPQVQVALDKSLHILAANLTAIAFITFRHADCTRWNPFSNRCVDENDEEINQDKPNTSNMLYKPFGLSISHFAAANAPDA